MFPQCNVLAASIHGSSENCENRVKKWKVFYTFRMEMLICVSSASHLAYQASIFLGSGTNNWQFWLWHVTPKASFYGEVTIHKNILSRTVYCYDQLTTLCMSGVSVLKGILNFLGCYLSAWCSYVRNTPTWLSGSNRISWILSLDWRTLGQQKKTFSFIWWVAQFCVLKPRCCSSNIFRREKLYNNAVTLFIL